MIGIHSRRPSAPGGILALCATTWLGSCDGGTAASPDAWADAPPVIDATPAADAAMPADAFRADASRADAWVPPQGATCLDPFLLNPGDSHSSDTSALLSDVSADCSAGSSIAPDAIYAVAMGDPPRDLTARVAVDEEASPPFDVVLHARTDCADAEAAIGCSDVAWGERLELLAVSGSVTLIVDGTEQYGGVRQGAYTLTTAARDIVAMGADCDPTGVTSRCPTDSRCVAGVCVADDAPLACSLASADPTDVVATTQAFASDFYSGSCAYDPLASFPEQLYQLHLTEASDVVATTDFSETDFDTYLYLRSTACDGAEVACQDDVDPEHHNLASTLSAPGLAAGTYYLFVDGSSASPGTGTYRLQVTITPST